MQPGRSRLISAGAAAAIVLPLILLYAIRQILLPFVVAGIVAFLCAPVADWLAARARLPRWCWALTLLLLISLAFVLLAVIAVPHLLEEFVRITANLEGEIKHLIEGLLGNRGFRVLDTSLNPQQLAHSAVLALRGWLSSDKVLIAAAWGFSAMFGLILTGVLLVYFLLDTQRIARGLLWLVPPGRRPFIRRWWSELEPVLRRYFLGIVVIVTYATAAAYVGLGLILHLHHAALLALLTGLLELLPIVGPGMSALVGGLVAIQEATNAWNVLAYAVYAIALRVSIDQLFGPLVLGRATHVQPPLVIFCFLTGAVLFGVTGIILALPVALAIKVFLTLQYGDEITNST